MMPLSELGMTDFATRRSRSAHFGLVLFGSLVVVVLYVVYRNYLFVEAGLLRPNFSTIHQAYDFNLWELPWTLIGVGVPFLLFGLFARRRYLWGAFVFVFLAADLFALRYYVTEAEPQRLVVRRIRLETPKLSVPVRLLHISDIQSGGITDYERKIFETIESLQPDLILNTGDYLQVVPPATFDSELPKLMELMRRVNPRLGMFGVFGDTELELYRVSQEALEPLQILSSSSATVETGGGQISLHGLSLYESRHPEWAKRTASQWLAESDPRDFRILLGHAPDYALAVKEEPIDLCLAGHTHGGQVCLPFYGPLVIDSAVPRDWATGFRRIGIPYLNVSAGAGSNRYKGLPPLRFNCPTEMTLIELVPLKPIR